MILAEQRVGPEIGERVVHPAQIPFEPEPESPQVCRARHHRPRSRLLGDAVHLAVIAVYDLVELLQKRHRCKILAAAERVRDPLAGVARMSRYSMEATPSTRSASAWKTFS